MRVSSRGQVISFFIGLPEPEAERRGEVWFFDVADKPPRRGRPRRVDPPSGQARSTPPVTAALFGWGEVGMLRS